MIEFVHKNIDAESVFGKEIREVHEQLVNAVNYSSMLSIIETFLHKKLKQIKDDMRPIDKIGQLIIDNPQDFELQKKWQVWRIAYAPNNLKKILYNK